MKGGKGRSAMCMGGCMGAGPRVPVRQLLPRRLRAARGRWRESGELACDGRAQASVMLRPKSLVCAGVRDVGGIINSAFWVPACCRCLWEPRCKPTRVQRGRRPAAPCPWCPLSPPGAPPARTLIQSPCTISRLRRLTWRHVSNERQDRPTNQPAARGGRREAAAGGAAGGRAERNARSRTHAAWQPGPPSPQASHGHPTGSPAPSHP